MLLKLINFLDDIIIAFIRIIFIVILLLGIYFVYDSFYVYNHASNKDYMKYNPRGKAEEPLENLSDDVVGWIEVDNTTINFPVMQGKTNMEYLNKDPYGNYSLTGSIFLDCRNSPTFEDSYSILYGHHMGSGLMFGALDDFRKKEFFEEHKTGTLTLKDNRSYKITLFASADISASTDTVFNRFNVKVLNEYLEENSIIYEKPNVKTDTLKVIGMTTCKTPDSIDRTCVFAYISEEISGDI